MPEWAAIVIIALASFISGRLLVTIFAERSGRFDGDRIAVAFSSLTAGIVVLGWIALILAELGWFSLGLMAVIWLVLTLSLAAIMIWFRRSETRDAQPPLSPQPESPIPILRFLPSWSEYAFLVVWFIVASWLFFRPHEFIVGGADAGVYANLAASINDSGSILIEDQTLANLDPDFYPAILRPLPESDRGTNVAPYYLFPGFYVTDAESGSVMPQFYPLHPVWQAVAYAFGEIESALLMTGFWAILGGLALYLTIRELMGWEAAAIGLIGLSLTAMQVWFARYPTTEMLTQFLLWAAIWSTLMWLKGRQPRALWAFLAGAAFGEVLLVRIDTYFLLAVLVFVWFYLRWSGQWRKEDWWFFAPFGALAIHSLVHAQTQSTPYFYNTFGYGLNLLQKNWIIPLLGLLVVGAILLLAGRHRHLSSTIKRYRRPILIAGIFAILLLFVYGWFIRPSLGDEGALRDYWYAGGQIPTQLDQENLIRLGWYLSPLGIALAAAGICLMLWQINARTALILGIGLFISLLCLWRIQANPHQIYTMRRYVPAVLPFFILATAYLFGWMLRQHRRWIIYSGIALAVLWIAGLAWSARGFVSQIDYDGIIAQMDDLNSQLEPDSVLLFIDQNPITLGDIVGNPLQYLYGHSVYSLRDVAELDIDTLRSVVERWEESGRTVYWVGDTTLIVENGLSVQNSFVCTLSTPQLETSYEHKPTQILDIIWKLEISQLN